MRWLVCTVAALVVAGATAFTGYAMNTDAHAQSAPALGPGLVTVEIDIRYSKFSISTLRVRKGTLVRFLVRNADPIHHEFVVGDASVHVRHQRGTEASHPPVPGEVSVLPDDVGVTFYEFERAGRFEYACHLPGHFAYGMKGWVVVEE